MRKFALMLIVFALTVPAMGAVNITLEKGTDANEVVIGYENDAAEEVRAVAIEISVSGDAYVPGSAQFASDPNTDDYYVAPGSMTFTIVDGNTVIDQFGSPIAEEDPCGGVLEVATLYAASDPNHPLPPPSSGTLCRFYVDCSGGPVTVSIPQVNAKRGGVVLKNPEETPTVVLPDDLIICGDPPCWLCDGQPFGDCNGSGNVNILDYFLFKKAYGTNDTDPHGTGIDEYNCCCDFNHDGNVNILDYFTFKKYYGQIVGTVCADISCP